MLTLYWTTAKKASGYFLRSWLLVPISIGLFLINVLLMGLAAPLGFAGGFIIGLGQLLLLTVYYNLLIKSLEPHGLRFKQLQDLDFSLFFDLLSVAFIFFIAKFLVHSLFSGMGELQAATLLLQLGIVILFNCIPEVIYLSRQQGLEALTTSLQFIKNFWLEWFIPLLLLAIPAILFYSDATVLLLARSHELLPPLFIIQGWMVFGDLIGGLATLVALIVASWFMLFRAELYRALEGRSRPLGWWKK